MHAIPRQNLKNLTADARRLLNDRIIGYINSAADPVSVHEEHFGMAHGPLRFILWHRNFLREFDEWQRKEALQNNVEFLPLAYWYPGDPIPVELPHQGRNNNIPTFPVPESLSTRQGLENLPDFAEFGTKLEDDYHNGIHEAIGGDMAGGRSPADPIFWPMHAYFDHLAAYWETIHGDVGSGGPGA